MKKQISMHRNSGPNRRTLIASTSAVALVLVGLVASGPGAAYADDSGTPAGTSSVQEYLADNPQIKVVDPAVLNSDSASVIDGNGDVVEVLGGSSDDGNRAEVSQSGAAVNPEAQAGGGGATTQATDCNTYRSAIFLNLTGYQESVTGCSIIGYDWTARYNYVWKQDPTGKQSGPSCVQGRGYQTNQSNDTPAWYNAGCGAGGGVNAYIGQRASLAKIRGFVELAGTVGYVQWH